MGVVAWQLEVVEHWRQCLGMVAGWGSHWKGCQGFESIGLPFKATSCKCCTVS